MSGGGVKLYFIRFQLKVGPKIFEPALAFLLKSSTKPKTINAQNVIMKKNTAETPCSSS
uniref:Uncharacterized protein n=1 Tax=Rhizophora mucronata TaxID=61149 RepID=A0A2P2NWV5_RHIMU